MGLLPPGSGWESKGLASLKCTITRLTHSVLYLLSCSLTKTPAMADIEKTRANDAAPRPDVAAADEALLASLGYKQEFKREFTGLEVCICVIPLNSRCSIRIHTTRRRLGLRSASSDFSRQSRPY